MSTEHPVDPSGSSSSSWDTRGLLPRRNLPRPEDVDVEPLRLDALVAARWRKWRPALGHWGGFALRYVLPLWAVAATAFLVVHLREDQHRREAREEWEARKAGLIEPATRDVEDVLGVIRHGVDIDHIKFGYSRYASAWYTFSLRSITLNLNVEWDPETLLSTVAHECVHALFHWAKLSGNRESLEHRLVEETTAYVLGAHIAGEVLSRRGGDGEAFTRALVADYRALCKVDSPGSARQRFLGRAFREESNDIDPDRVWGIMTHFGNERIVDEIDEICSRVRDPWDVAHEVALTYKLYLKLEPAEVPQPYKAGMEPAPR